jgi:leucyl aminopeptidase
MSLQIQVVSATPEAHSAPLLILVVPQGSRPESIASLDTRIGGVITRCYKAGDFTGKKDETAMFYPDEGGGASRILLVGIGKPASARSAVRRLTGSSRTRRLTTSNPSWLLMALLLPPEGM